LFKQEDYYTELSGFWKVESRIESLLIQNVFTLQAFCVHLIANNKVWGKKIAYERVRKIRYWVKIRLGAKAQKFYHMFFLNFLMFFELKHVDLYL
jgi:hypothetical protein